jgi:hypothetical protein
MTMRYTRSASKPFASIRAASSTRMERGWYWRATNGEPAKANALIRNSRDAPGLDPGNGVGNSNYRLSNRQIGSKPALLSNND